MAEQKEILICGLMGCQNFGDQAILQCTEKLIRKAVEAIGKRESVRLETVDFTMGYELGTKNTKLRTQRSLSLAKQLKCKPIKSFLSLAKECLIIFKLRRYVAQILTSNISVIIFAGGGIIKFKYQKFYLYINEFTKRAQKLGIPVMFSGVGVEGYNLSDPRCQMLIKALNRDCVKSISTRDDFLILKNIYLKQNSKCLLYKVSDPVCGIKKIFSLPDCITSNSNIIGLGLSRFEIFRDNGVNIGREQIISIWKKIIEHLDHRHIQWKIFTTGLPCDYEAELELKKHLGSSYPDECFLPRPQSLLELLEQISCFKATCVCRLHASIISYSLDIPTMAFVWNDKQNMFANDIGWSDFFLSKPQMLDSATMNNTLDRLILNENYGYKTDGYTDSVYLPILNFIKKNM